MFEKIKDELLYLKKRQVELRQLIEKNKISWRDSKYQEFGMIKFKLKFLENIGLTSECIPSSFLEKNENYRVVAPYVEREFIRKYSKPFRTKFCIKDVRGTRHPDYMEKPFVNSFLGLKRVEFIIDKYYDNPEYYSKSLKNPNFHEVDNLRLYRLADGDCYIDCGNNRITFLKMLYMGEMAKAKTEDEKKAIDEKFTFYADVKSLPKNKMIAYYIMFLDWTYNKQIEIEFKGSNPDECLYEITLNGETMLIENEKQLKKLVSMEFDYNSCQNVNEVCRKIANQHNTTYLDFESLYDEFNPNFEDTFLKASKLLEIDSYCRLYSKDDLFNGEKFKCSGLDFDNVLSGIINDLRERQVDYLKNDVFVNLNSAQDVEKSMEKIKCNLGINNLLDIDVNDYLVKYDLFSMYFEKNKSDIPETIFSSANYYDFLLNFFDTLYKMKLERYEKSEEQKDILNQQIFEKRRIKDLLSHEEEYHQVKRNDSELSFQIDNLKFNQHLSENDLQFNTELKSKLVNELKEYEQSNIFHRLRNKNKIENIKARIAEYENKIAKIEKEIELVRKKLETIKIEKLKNLEKFQKICGCSIELEEYKALTENISDFDLEKEIKRLEEEIKKLNIGEMGDELKQLIKIIEEIKNERKIDEEQTDYTFVNFLDNSSLKKEDETNILTEDNESGKHR